MSTRQTRICKRCQRENLQDARCCVQCGAKLTWFSRRAFIMALGLTAIPLVIMPILMLLSIDPSYAGLSFGFPYIAAILATAILMAVFLVVGAIVGVVVRRKNPPVARGIFIGVGAGLVVAFASCVSSFAILIP